MELVKNIFFNTDKLVQNSTVKISYTGKFFEDNSTSVYIHYGFGVSWDNLSEIKMEKTDLGFQAEIYLLESNTFNFCLRNDKNEWDNNNSQNYVFNLEVPSSNLIVSDIDLAIDRPNKLRKSYIWSKKVRIAVYKIITFIPKILSGNYKRKITSQ